MMTNKGVLTGEGVRFLNGLCDLLDGVVDQGNEFSILDTIPTEKLPGADTHFPFVGRLPHTIPGYGPLVENTSTPLVAKCRPLRHIGDPKQRSTVRNQPEHGGKFKNETYGEVRVWEEAKARGHEDYFAPIIAYDAEEFRWLVMVEVEVFRDPKDHRTKRFELENKLEELGWVPDDTEVGKLDGVVAYDYGRFRRERDEWLVRELEN